MDKLTVINNALIATGNNRVNILNDPSDEYQVASNAFERAIKVLRVTHAWPFSETIVALVRAPNTDNKSRRYPDHCFLLPTTALHVGDIIHDQTPLTAYEIIGDKVSCDYPDSIYARAVFEAPDAVWHPLAEEVLTLMVEAGCLRGLNEDFKEAANADAKATGMLYDARSRVDQQNPARNLYRSSIAAARRTRRV